MPSPRSLNVDQTWGALIAFSPHSVVDGRAPLDGTGVSFGTGYAWFARISSTSERAASESTTDVPADLTKIALTIQYDWY